MDPELDPDREPDPDSLGIGTIRESGPKCHGSPTLHISTYTYINSITCIPLTGNKIFCLMCTTNLVHFSSWPLPAVPAASPPPPTPSAGAPAPEMGVTDIILAKIYW